MHLMICSLPSSFNNAFVCRKIYANGVRAEPMKKANENRFFMAQVHHGFDEICSNGGRAEQSTKMFGIDFVDAHGPTELL